MIDFDGTADDTAEIAASKRKRLHIHLDPAIGDAGPVYVMTADKSPSALNYEFRLDGDGLRGLDWETNAPCGKIRFFGPSGFVSRVTWSHD